MDMEVRSLTKPQLRLEEYFPGRTRAYGIFQDRFGKLRRRFLVEIAGTLNGSLLTLVENFCYDDGEREQRTWSIKCLDHGLYEGHTDGVLGTAQGAGQENVLNWSYSFALPIGERRWKVRFNDWFFLHEDDVLFNRAEISKFGIRLGEATMVFHKLD
ncbi:DUF3833 domain-containing protein [Denitrobaculum tricleocarpae]|uniref:DUF3833 domain-containing protein n=2 Tax=Denitrobaculum tricleocarpae TaxID=2591009 RepID=A0A545TYP6_9PROT|nr:DUF3833 domain-containing protein [Denitrobaculum tricleocarpae]